MNQATFPVVFGIGLGAEASWSTRLVGEPYGQHPRLSWLRLLREV